MTNAELADKYALAGWIDITNVDDPKEWQQIIAALRQPSSDKVLVPREPTQEMCDAFYNEEAISDGDCMTGFTAGYRAMLAAEGDR